MVPNSLYAILSITLSLFFSINFQSAFAQQLALNERSQVWFGMWTNPEKGYSDTPDLLNRRLGFNVSVFQLAQLLPLPKYNVSLSKSSPLPIFFLSFFLSVDLCFEASDSFETRSGNSSSSF